MPEAFINRIATAVPPHDVHDTFLRFGRLMLKHDNRRAGPVRPHGRAQRHRAPLFLPGARRRWRGGGCGRLLPAGRFSRHRGAHEEVREPAPRAWRWRRWKSCWRARTARASPMSSSPVAPAFPRRASTWNWWSAAACRPSVERTMVGFMGCYAAINALKLARHIVRSEPERAGAGGQSGTLHPASARDRRSGGDPVLPAVRRWLRRGAGQRRSGRRGDEVFPRRAGAGHARTDPLAYPPAGLRHGAVGRACRAPSAPR